MLKGHFRSRLIDPLAPRVTPSAIGALGPDVAGALNRWRTMSAIPAINDKGRSKEVATIKPWLSANRPTMLPIENRTSARLGLGSRASPDNILGRACDKYARRAH